MKKQMHFSTGAHNAVYSLCKGGFCDVSVLVIGDIMLDRYISGEVKRISPEAPVPVLRVKEEYSVLGGAGNVVMNILGLGAKAEFLGRVGDDGEGSTVTEMLCGSGVKADGLIRRGSTVVKTRLLGNGRQQMIRLDREEHLEPASEEIAFYISGIEAAFARGVKAAVISDYGKGMFFGELSRRVIDLCAEHGIPVLVDPKGTDWERYSGASIVTPNLSELAAVSGRQLPNEDGAVAEAGRSAMEKYSLNSILVTRSEKGVTLITRQETIHEPALPVDVYDVSGAGDTVIGVTAASIAAGLGTADAIRLANAAAQIVVGKIGTSPVERLELLEFLGETDTEGKLRSAADAAAQIDKWRSNGEKVVFTNGCFDIFHAGHADSLARARSLGDRLVVGLNSDASVKILKGKSRPVNTQKMRARVLDALSDVDMVVIFEEETPEKLLSLLRPDILAKGGDYRPEELVGGQYAAEIAILPLLDGLSTTGIIERMNSDGNL